MSGYDSKYDDKKDGYGAAPPPAYGQYGVGPATATTATTTTATSASYYYQYTPEDHTDRSPLNPTAAGPADVEAYGAGTVVDECPRPVKMAFLRKVYLILLLQIGLTMGIGALFMFVEEVKLWVQANYWIVWVNFIPTIIVLVVLVWKRRNYPANFILLMVFTLLEAYTLGVIVSYVDVDTVLQAIIITFAVFLGLTLFTFQTKFDFSGLGPILTAALFGLCMMGLMFLFFPYNDTLQIVYCVLGVIVFTGLILFDTYSILHRLTPEEYIMGAVQLYLDIINLFLFILRLLQACKN